MANPWKNFDPKISYNATDIARRVLEQSRSTTVEQRIRSLREKEELQKSVYAAVIEEAEGNSWTDSERRAAIAILRELFDGNPATIAHVIDGAEARHPGLPYAVCQHFDEQIDADRELAERLGLPGMFRLESTLERELENAC